MIFIKTTPENITGIDRAILAALIIPHNYARTDSASQAASNETDADISLEELERLAETAGIEVFAKVKQSKSAPDTGTYLGKGKLEEIKQLTDSDSSVTMLIVDDELSPTQIRNIEKILGDKIEVIDRTMLILEIFSMHAKTGEGKLQVEIAMLKYTMPRLTGKGVEMSRLAGNSGGGMGARRGSGETKLEIDRRNIKSRTAVLEEELKNLSMTRDVMRSRRKKSGIPCVAVAGYTNAGKSTLLNTLTDSDILAEDKLFATLDPTTRKLIMPNKSEILLTDTVGFISKLPHHLVKAFQSTLDEVKYADIILIVCDISDNEYKSKLDVVKNILNELDCASKPTIIAYNKCDAIQNDELQMLKENAQFGEVFISAKNNTGIEDLLDAIQTEAERQNNEAEFIFPQGDQSGLNYLYKYSTVLDVEYGSDNITVKAVVDKKTKGMFSEFLLV